MELAELHRRLAATRWPSRELVTDRAQDVQSATIQELARYWASDHDEVDRGGHFAAREEPQLFAEEMRAAFRSLR